MSLYLTLLILPFFEWCLKTSLPLIKIITSFIPLSLILTHLQTSAGECKIFLYCKCKQKFRILLPMSVNKVESDQVCWINLVSFVQRDKSDLNQANKQTMLIFWKQGRKVAQGEMSHWEKCSKEKCLSQNWEDSILDL